MYIFKTVESLQNYILKIKKKGLRIGFVPTMGALHNGHLSLIEKAKNSADITVCSIFVNPTQFNDANDLIKYPVTTEKDINLLNTAKTDVLFLPTASEIYPENIDTSVNLDFGTLDKLMEGKHRPGHFAGVAQVVKRLLDIVQPNMLFMGQKDYQQFCICRNMIQQFNLPVDIVMCSIVREKDGLAMSSRNIRLSDEQRKIANKIHEVLSKISDDFDKNRLFELKSNAINSLNKIPEFRLDYLEIADGETLLPATKLSKNIIVCVAVYLGDIRLIDNMVLQ